MFLLLYGSHVPLRASQYKAEYWICIKHSSEELANEKQQRPNSWRSCIYIYNLPYLSFVTLFIECLWFLGLITWQEKTSNRLRCDTAGCSTASSLTGSFSSASIFHLVFSLQVCSIIPWRNILPIRILGRNFLLTTNNQPLRCPPPSKLNGPLNYNNSNSTCHSCHPCHAKTLYHLFP